MSFSPQQSIPQKRLFELHAVFLRGEGFVEDLVDERAFAAAGYARDTGENAQQYLHIDIFQVFLSGAADRELFAAAGAVVGAFIVICLVFVRHIASDKVYSARTLKNRIGLRVLGRMPVSKRCKIDRFICKMEKRVCEPALAATAANIRNYCSGTQHMLVAGNDAQQAEAVMRLIREQTGMTVTCCGSLLQDVNALQALPACDTVLLVETCHKSTYSDIEASIQLVEDQGKALIGCMLIGG